MTTFDAALQRVLAHEGGFQANPSDAGNWANGKLVGTKYGISARSYPTLDIANLQLKDAREIYRRDFWDRCGCEQLPEAVRFDVFDTAINSGPSRAVLFLQRSVGVEDDGVFGPKTAAAVMAMDPLRLFARFNGHRLDFINDNPQQWARFGRGWAQRIADNLKAA